MSLVFEQQIALVAAALLAAATLARVWAFAAGRAGDRATFTLLAAAVAVLGVMIAGRWIREGQGPFLTMYDVLLSNAFSLGLLFLLVSWRLPVVRSASLVACPVLAILGIWMLVVPSEGVPLPPTFDNDWLWVHVGAGKLFLGVCLASMSAAALLLLRQRAADSRRMAMARDPEALTRAVWLLFFLAFVFHSFMLVAGAVWAHSAWGRYWSWDPLETWTLATWLLLGFILHARATFKGMPENLGYSLVIASFVLAFLTFFGVPLINNAPHKGVM